MEQDKNKRLDELFNQAKNEPSKVSFDEIKEQFVKSNSGAGSASVVSKLIQMSNLKIIVMISTLSIIVAGAFLFVSNSSEDSKNKESVYLKNEFSAPKIETINEEHKEVVNLHLEKVKLLSPNLKEIYRVKKKLALKLKESPLDSTRKVLRSYSISKRNKEILDTAFRFPQLGYEEISANNKQKMKMFGKIRRKNKKKLGNSWYQSDPKGFLFIPMESNGNNEEKNSVQAFYMKQTEVTNLEYRTFLFDLLIQGKKDEFLIAKPDQKMWVKEYPNALNKPMQDNYFSHPAYDNYPAVCMSRNGAIMYCQWFTEELNKVKVKSGGVLVNNVRLPSEIEWEWAASGGNKKSPYPWGGPYLRNDKGCFLANFKPEVVTGSMKCFHNFKNTYTDKEGIIDSVKTQDDVIIRKKFKNPYSADGGYHAVKVDSYNPNDYGLYCMSGNVAEMVYYQDENMLPGTKGGSWSSIGQELQVVEGKDRFKGQTDPSCNIGFRPVITYLSVGNKNKGTKERVMITPPGTKKINENLFFDETEVTNFMWEEYLFWQANKYGKNSVEYMKSLPDTTVWGNTPYKNFYLWHPAYKNYPVVGISYEQVLKFCKWRTDRVKELFDIQKQKDKKSIYPKTFSYRLPTKEEWEEVARVGYSLKTLKKLETKYEGKNRCNLKREEDDNMGVAGKLNSNADVTAPVLSYWPNKYGIYNLIGNVAEMTIEKGIAKGGSWIHTEEEASYEKAFNYTKPTKWVGFRCVLEVNEN